MSRWPDIEKSLVAYLRTTTGIRTATRIPPDVEKLPGFIRVARGPGTDDLVTDAPTIDIESFTPETSQPTDYATATDLAETIRQAMHALAGRQFGGVLVDLVRTSVGPVWVDYRNPATNRFVASYRIEFRQQFNS